MAPESKQSFLFTGVRAHARLQFRLRHPPRFIVPQLIRLSYRRNTAPPLRSIKFANRPGEIRRDTPVPTNYRPNEIDTLEIRSLVKTEREKKKREFSFDDENDFVHLARSNKYSLFFLFFFSKQTGSKIDYQVYRFEDSFRKRRGRSNREKEEERRRRRGGLCSLDSISNLRSLCPMPPTSSWRKEKEREPAGIPVISIQEAL